MSCLSTFVLAMSSNFLEIISDLEPCTLIPLICVVPVALGTCALKLADGIVSLVKFLGHLAQDDPGFDLGLTRFPTIDDGFHVQNLLPKLFQVAVQLEMGPTCRKRSDEDVSHLFAWNVIQLMFAQHLEGVLIDESDIPHVQVGILEHVVQLVHGFW